MKMFPSWLLVIKQIVKFYYENLQTMDIAAIQSIVDYVDWQIIWIIEHNIYSNLVIIMCYL